MTRGQFNRTFMASMVLLGGTVGAGILGIPYVISRVGWRIGFFYLLVLGFFTLVINLMVGEIASRTKGYVHFSGYAKLYLGEFGKKILGVIFMINIYGALLAYIIGEGQVLSTLFGYSSFMWSLIFVVISTFLIYLGDHFWARFNLLFTILLAAALFLIIFIGLPSIKTRFLYYSDWSYFFLPYGVILFAMSGFTMIPSVEQIVEEKQKLFRYSLLLGTFLPVLFYSFFAFVVVGVMGLETTQVATIGLGEALGSNILVLGNVFAFFSIATSFLVLGGTLKNLWQWDYGKSSLQATFFAVFIPILFFLLGARGFVSVLSFFGSVAIGLIAILSVIIFWKAREKGQVPVERALAFPRLIGVMVILVSLCGIIAAVFESLK